MYEWLRRGFQPLTVERQVYMKARQKFVSDSKWYFDGISTTKKFIFVLQPLGLVFASHALGEHYFGIGVFYLLTAALLGFAGPFKFEEKGHRNAIGATMMSAVVQHLDTAGGDERKLAGVRAEFERVMALKNTPILPARFSPLSLSDLLDRLPGRGPGR